jgi:excisionase family DNA binding protein
MAAAVISCRKMATSSLPQYVDVATLSARTGIAKSTWRQWIAQQKLPAYRLPAGQIRVRLDDVDALFTPVTPKASA